MRKILILFLVLLFPTIVCAKAVTKEDLVEAANYYNNICDSEEKKYVAKEDGTCTVPQTIEVTDDKVIITDNTSSSEPEVFEFSYTINESGTVVFTYVEEVKKGMTEEQFRDASSSGVSVLYPALLVAKAEGARMSDYGTYLMSVLINKIISAFSNPDNQVKYIIVADGVTVENPDDYDFVIPENEFGDYVIRIAEKQYENPMSLKDDDTEKGEINSFVYAATFTKIDDENGKITSSITVDTNADYTKVAGVADRVDDDTPGDDGHGSVDPTTEPVPESQPQQQEDNPKTGAAVSALIAGLMLIIAIALYRLYGRRLIQKI